MGCRLWLCPTKEARGVQHRVTVGRPVHQDSHRWDVVHTVRRYMALLVAVEPVEGEATPRRVVCPPSSLISDRCRNGGLILQLVSQRCGGKLALVPVGHRGEKGEGAAEEPCEVHLQWLLCRRIHADIEVLDPVRWREAAAPQARGIQVMYAIPTVAPLLVSTDGPHRRFGVRHQPVHAWLLGQPPDVRQEDHGLPFLGGAHSRGNMGPVRPLPTLGDPCHSHACQRRPNIHLGYSSAEGCQCRQVMELDTRPGARGQDLGGVGGQAVKGQVPVVLAEMGLQGRVELGRQRTHRAERVV